MINKRLSDLSCNEEEFEKAKLLLETALNRSAYKITITYQKNNDKQQKHSAQYYMV